MKKEKKNRMLDATSKGAILILVMWQAYIFYRKFMNTQEMQEFLTANLIKTIICLVSGIITIFIVGNILKIRRSKELTKHGYNYKERDEYVFRMKKRSQITVLLVIQVILLITLEVVF